MQGFSLKMLDGYFLCLNTLPLMSIEELIETEVGRHLCGVGEEIKNEERGTERHNLDKDNWF